MVTEIKLIAAMSLNNDFWSNAESIHHTFHGIGCDGGVDAFYAEKVFSSTFKQ